MLRATRPAQQPATTHHHHHHHMIIHTQLPLPCGLCAPGSLMVIPSPPGAGRSPGMPLGVKNTTGIWLRTISGPPGGGPTSRGTAAGRQGSRQPPGRISCGGWLSYWQCSALWLSGPGSAFCAHAAPADHHHAWLAGISACSGPLHAVPLDTPHPPPHHTTPCTPLLFPRSPALRRTTLAGHQSWPSTLAHTTRPGLKVSRAAIAYSSSSPCRWVGVGCGAGARWQRVAGAGAHVLYCALCC